MESDKVPLRQVFISKAPKQTVSQRLEPVLSDIEDAIKSGLGYESIVAILAQQGYGEIPVETFRSTLYRLRKRAAKHAHLDQSKGVRCESQPVMTSVTRKDDGKSSAFNEPVPIVSSTIKQTEPREKFDWSNYRGKDIPF